MVKGLVQGHTAIPRATEVSLFYLEPSTFPLYCYNLSIGLLRWLSGKESTCQCRSRRRLRFDLWVRRIPCRRKWQPTPVFWPGESHGQRSLVTYSTWCHKKSDTTEWVGTHTTSLLIVFLNSISITLIGAAIHWGVLCQALIQAFY